MGDPFDGSASIWLTDSVPSRSISIPSTRLMKMTKVPSAGRRSDASSSAPLRSLLPLLGLLRYWL